MSTPVEIHTDGTLWAKCSKGRNKRFEHDGKPVEIYHPNAYSDRSSFDGSDDHYKSAPTVEPLGGLNTTNTMTDAELEKIARSLANELALINNLNIGPRTLDAILAALQKVSAVAHEDGAKGVLLIRCIEHLNVPQQNSNEHLGAECGGCLAAKLTAAEAQVERLKGENEELLIKNNRLADDADKAEFYLKQSRQELEAERRERGLKSIDRICDTCGGEKDSEGRCAMCFQSKLTAAEAQLAECQKERDEAKRHIYLASGFAMRSGRELEIATVLEETPESDRDSADNTIGELLDMIDAGRSVVSRLTAEVERLRECLQSMLDAYEELHAKYDLGDCEATIAARAAMFNPEKQ